MGNFMLKKTGLFIFLLIALTLLLVSPTLAAYSDVPVDSWAAASIQSAATYDLMQGQGENLFGYGQSLTKAEFATMLTNMFHWPTSLPNQPSFSDVTSDAWYYPYIETAAANDVLDAGGAFHPDQPISREEMAIMFVRALGLKEAAKQNVSLPFTDVVSNQGYIGVAYDIGMINGISDTSFSPNASAKREEAAAMLVRIYEKYYGDEQFLHGFYAISSYAQKDLAAQMDAVTYMWSTMILDDSGAWLNTSNTKASSTFVVPQGYEDIITYLQKAGVKMHLGVYMSDQAEELLLSTAYRQQAVEAIIEEVSVTYQTLGSNPYSGVTIDFEGLQGEAVRQGFTSFLTDLQAGLSQLNKTLYVAVQPKLAEGSYFDGFDYRAIGDLADKVIVMAHDYQPANLNGMIGTTWQKNAALTPIADVYYSLKAAVDPVSGVRDANKVVLAVSFTAVGWPIDNQGKVSSGTPKTLSITQVGEILNAGATSSFSLAYQNPYLTYTDKTTGEIVYLWFENQRSINEKTAIARLLGINGVSIWRIGNIPNNDAYTVDIHQL